MNKYICNGSFNCDRSIDRAGSLCSHAIPHEMNKSCSVTDCDKAPDGMAICEEISNGLNAKCIIRNAFNKQGE